MPKAGECRSKMVTYNNKQYVSITDCMKAYGLRAANFHSWWKNSTHSHLSLQEAVITYIDMKLNRQLVRSTDTNFKVSKMLLRNENDDEAKARERKREQLTALLKYRTKANIDRKSVMPIRTILSHHLDPYEIIYLIHATGCTLTEAMTCASMDLSGTAELINNKSMEKNEQ